MPRPAFVFATALPRPSPLPPKPLPSDRKISTPPTRTPVAPLVRRIQSAIRDNHLGLALDLLSQYPNLGLPEHTAHELSGKLRQRRIPGKSHINSEQDAFNLLSTNHTQQSSLHLPSQKIHELADRGCVSEALQLLRTSHDASIGADALDSLLRAATKRGLLRDSEYILQSVYYRFNLRPTALAYARFIDACGKIGNLHRAALIVDTPDFVKLSSSEKTHVYATLIDACVRCRALTQAHQLVASMKRRRIPASEAIYVSLLTGASRSRPLEESFRLLHEMRADGFSPSSTAAYNAVILGAAQAGRLFDAFKVYQMMLESETVKPDLDTFNALLSCCAKKADPDSSFKVLQRMRTDADIKPNPVSYNWIVVACAKAADVERAFQVATTMQGEGIRLNVVTNNNLLEACCNAGRLERAFSIVKNMIQAQGIHPNSHTYNALIRGCGRWGQLEAALRLLTSMQKAGVSPTVITYSVAVDACARAGGAVAVDQAFELVTEMRRVGLEPNIVTYNSLIHACARGRRADLAFQVLDTIKLEKITPDIVTLCSLVDACGRSGQISKAFEATEVLPQQYRSLQLNVPVYNALIQACFKAGDLERMRATHEDMKRQSLRANVVTYSTLISAYASLGDIEHAVLMLDEMKVTGLKPNRVTFTSIIAGYGRMGDVDLAMEVLEEAKAACGEPDEELYTAAIVAAIVGGRKEQAVRLAKQMSRAGYVIPTVFNSMMKKVGDVERSAAELRQMLVAMEALNIRPQRAALESLMSAHAKEADVKSTFELLPVMQGLGYPPNLQTYKKIIQACSLSGEHAHIRRARALFRKLRSSIKDNDVRLRSHHWRELYEAVIRAIYGVRSEDADSEMLVTMLKGMGRDCGNSFAIDLAMRLCPNLLDRL